MKNFKNKIVEYWKDPVWSNVIAFIIITIGTSLIGAIIVSIKSLYQKISFDEMISDLIDYSTSSVSVNKIIFWVASIVLIISILNFSRLIYLRSKRRNHSNEALDEDSKPALTGMNSIYLFSERLSGAFPGHRGFEWYNSTIAVKRLTKLFEPPLTFKPVGKDATTHPFWWFRGISSMYVEKFQKLSKTKILLGIKELDIKRIGVYVSPQNYNSFIYVETKGIKPTGLYKYSKSELKHLIDSFGYIKEEYAIFKGREISREHFDDGATIINGNAIDTFGSELRARYITNYNFIIAAHQSSFNSQKFEIETQAYFNEILQGNKTAEGLIEELKGYEKEFYR